jgi:hypothetical protein
VSGLRDAELDHLVRDMMIELASEGRPVNLAGPALRSARLLRTRRRIAAAVSVLVLIAGLAVVAAAGTAPPVDPPVIAESSAVPSGPPSGLPPSSPGHGPDGKLNRPALLPDGWSVRGAPTAGGVAVFDDRTGTYREVAVPGGAASPDGRYVVSFAGGQAVRIHDVRADRDIANTLPGTTDTAPAWSMDSARFAYVNGLGQVVMVTLATGSGRSSWPMHCPAGCDLRWSNDDREVRVYLDGGVQAVDVETGAVAAGVTARQDDSDPCPGHRGYQIAATSLTPQERADLAGSQDVWGCVVPDWFQLTSAAGERSTMTDLTDVARGTDRVPDPARFTLFRWSG